MRFGPCPRESELGDRLDRGQWPDACSEELRGHVAGCRNCGELVLVKQMFGRERMKAAGEAQLEPPGVLWWRAQLRRRNAALESIGKPLLGAQIFALVVCLVAAGAYVVWQARRGFDWLAWFGDLPHALHLGALVPGSWSDSPWEIWLAASMAVMAVMGGVIVYVASEKRGGSS